LSVIITTAGGTKYIICYSWAEYVIKCVECCHDDIQTES